MRRSQGMPMSGVSAVSGSGKKRPVPLGLLIELLSQAGGID